MARKSQGPVKRAEPKRAHVLAPNPVEKAALPLPVSPQASSSLVGSRKENHVQFPYTSQAGKRPKPSSGVTITHIDAVPESASAAPAGYPSWFYPAVNQIVAPLISKLSELEQRVLNLDARQLDLDARFSDHKTMFITRYRVLL